MYWIHSKLVQLSEPVKVTLNDKKNTSLLRDMSIFLKLRFNNVLWYNPLVLSAIVIDSGNFQTSLGV